MLTILFSYLFFVGLTVDTLDAVDFSSFFFLLLVPQELQFHIWNGCLNSIFDSSFPSCIASTNYLEPFLSVETSLIWLLVWWGFN